MSILMILNDDNYYECMVTVLSVVKHIYKKRARVIFLESNLKRKNKNIVINGLEKYLQVRFIKTKNVSEEKDILNYDLRQLKSLHVSRVCFLQSNVLVRKEIVPVIKKYCGCIAAGRTIARDKKIMPKGWPLYDLGFCIVDFRMITDQLYTLEMAIQKGIVRDVELEDYFLVHPMISLEEVNRFYKKEYKRLELPEQNAAVVKLYSSLETRLLESTDVSKEWSWYLKMIDGAVERITAKAGVKESRVGFFSKKTGMFGTEFTVFDLPFLQKKYSGLSYVVKVFGIPVLWRKINGFFMDTYLCRVRISKEINFTYLDSIFFKCSCEIADAINKADQRLKKIYKLRDGLQKIKMIDSQELEKKVEQLAWYGLFQKLKSGEISQEDEILAGAQIHKLEV